ncbi:MAG: hypothetical protein JWM04_1889 [Verrucomicrobiales bacterium]|nr:hypothetical protein [Verrucomicrobiales bacterium]
MNREKKYDAIIIGAGPAGASAAAIIAEHGHKVLVLERSRFPRYHVGESLLPFTYHPLQRLGLQKKMEASAFVKKYSVQFVSVSGRASQPFYFETRYSQEIAQTYQVLRSEFDQMLLDNAREKGAEVMEGVSVTELLQTSGRYSGVTAHPAGGDPVAFHAPMILDCSGKESFAAVKNNWRVADIGLNKVAVWTYYKGARRDMGKDEGATTVAFVPDKGWFWYIPQHNDMVSVGVVAEGKYLARGGVRKPEEMFKREIDNNQWIKRYLEPGQCTGQYWIESEYTFRSKYCAADGLVLLGDAFGFLDPVFSSGVLLALKSGVMAGDTVHECLVNNDFSASHFTEYGNVMRLGVENMRKLVYAFYSPGFSFRKITDKYPELAGDITDCLSGDVNKDFSKLFTAVSEFAPLPEELPYGVPLNHPPQFQAA